MQITELEARVREAFAKGEALEVLGSASKRGIGKPVLAASRISLQSASGIEAYEPEELVLTALAGTPRAEAEKVLSAAGQIFAFEPPDLSHLLGSSGSGTLGGMAGCNFAGPRRVKAGAVRDHLLGFTAVSGRGEIFKAGGRVVKNVTGYDLPKLMAGSWGTLGIMHSLTFKVLPKPETEITLVVSGARGDDASAAMSAAMNSPAEVSGAAHLPEKRETFIRIEGVAPSLPARRAMLEKVLAPFGELAVLEAEASAAQWQAIRDVRVLNLQPEDAVWRISVAPADGHRVLAGVLGARGYLDWAGGLVWLAVPGLYDAGAVGVQAAIRVLGGHALLVKASDAVRARIACRMGEDAAIASLSRRVREAFDPKGILNPGRMG